MVSFEQVYLFVPKSKPLTVLLETINSLFFCLSHLELSSGHTSKGEQINIWIL